jgi:membrane protease YdiL (CAAX protease family)
LPKEAFDQSVSALGPTTVPIWHPLALVTLLVLVATAGHFLPGTSSAFPARGERIVNAYVPMLLVNWGLLLYVCRVGRPRFAFAELTGIRGYTAVRLATDVALAVLTAAGLMGGEMAWELAFGDARSSAVDALLPSTFLERIVWCVVAVSVGIAEEVVYRGYLLRELSHWTKSRSLGLLAQAVLFALAHGEQGLGAMARFFVYAVGLGALALARRSLVPGMLAHAAIDLLAGLTH